MYICAAGRFADIQQKRQAELKEAPEVTEATHGHPAARDEFTPSDDHLDGPVTPVGPSLVIRKKHRYSKGKSLKNNNDAMDGGFVVVDSDAMDGNANTSDKGTAKTASHKRMAIGHIITP